MRSRGCNSAVDMKPPLSERHTNSCHDAQKADTTPTHSPEAGNHMTQLRHVGEARLGRLIRIAHSRAIIHIGAALDRPSIGVRRENELLERNDVKLVERREVRSTHFLLEGTGQT